MSIKCILQGQDKEIHMTEIILPAGRMRGDVNGDGLVTIDDAYTIMNGIGSIGTKYYGTSFTEVFPDGDIPIDYLAADLDGNGYINTVDTNYMHTTSTIINYASSRSIDLLNNWIMNEAYAENMDWLYYIDISLPEIKRGYRALLLSSNSDISEKASIYSIEVLNNTVRIYTKRPPIEELKVKLLWWTQIGQTSVVAPTYRNYENQLGENFYYIGTGEPILTLEFKEKPIIVILINRSNTSEQIIIPHTNYDYNKLTVSWVDATLLELDGYNLTTGEESEYNFNTLNNKYFCTAIYDKGVL